MTLVTVIIPAYNAANTIAATLSSACSQTHAELQVLVVDDGSTDGTPDVVANWAEQDSRVALIRIPNGGVARARNAGLAQAAGEYVAPLDADDLWHPTKIARQLARITATSADLVYCWSVDIDENASVIERRLDVQRYEGEIIAPLIRANFIDNSSVPLIRRAALPRVGGWDETLRERHAQGCEDWLLYLRLAEHGQFALEPAFLVGYRQSSGAMSRNVTSMRASSQIVLDEGARRYPYLPPRLFRWARAAFDHYLADMLAVDGEGVAAALLRAAALVRDPTWAASRNARHRLRSRIGHRRSKITSPRGTYIDLAPDPEFFIPPDRWTRHRTAQLAAMTSVKSRER